MYARLPFENADTFASCSEEDWLLKQVFEKICDLH